jgi:hypothetical protein
VVVERLTSLPSSLHHVDAARQEYERQHHDGGLGLPNRWNTSRRIVIVVRAEGRDGVMGGGCRPMNQITSGEEFLLCVLDWHRRYNAGETEARGQFLCWTME